MIRDHLVRAAFNNAIKTLESSVYRDKKINEAIAEFSKRELADKLDLVEFIASHQNRFAVSSIEEGESLSLPSLGAFVIKQGSVIYRKHLDAIAKEYGYIDWYDVPLAERKELRKIVGIRQKEEQYQAKIRAVRDRKNGVLGIVDKSFSFRRFKSAKS